MEETSWPKLAFFLLHDCARCLALARQQQLACPAPHLSGDQFALNAVGISAAVPPTVLGDFCVALLQAGGWIRPARVREAHVWELTPAAHTWLAQPAPLQLQALREVWWRHLATADQALPALAFPEAVARRWQAVARAWYAWSAQLPLDSWTSQATVKVHLRRLGLYHIPVPWENLAHVPPAITHSLERLNAWLGQGVLLWLGFLECRNSNAGPEYRPLAEGQAWLRAALNDNMATTEASAVTAQEQCPVLERLPLPALAFPEDPEPPIVFESPATTAVNIQVRPAAPAACTYALQLLGELRQFTPSGAHYRLTSASLAVGRHWGVTALQLFYQLALANGGEVPPAVVKQVHTWEAETPVICATAGYQLTAVQDVLPGLRRRPAFARRVCFFPDAQTAWVSATEAPGLWAYLRRLGYAVQPEPASLEFVPGLVPGKAVTAEALLVALDTVQFLQQHVSGLAQLPLESLSASLRQVLPPERLLAARQLLESQVETLTRAGLGATATSEASESSREVAGVAANKAASDSLQPTLALLQQALAHGTPVLLTYIDAQAQVTRRRIRPLRLELQQEPPVLVAYCEWRGAERHFRLDRIVALDVVQT